MRRLILFLPLVIFLGLGIFLWRGLQLDPTLLPSALLNKPVPEFRLSSVFDPDKQITQQDLRGKPALLNVWATWCPTCKAEHAELNRIARDYGVTIYGVNYKDDRAKAKEWLSRYENPYALTIFDGDGKLGLDLGVYGAPETFLIDGNGVIRYRHVGAVDEKAWQKLHKIMQSLSGDKS